MNPDQQNPVPNVSVPTPQVVTTTLPPIQSEPEIVQTPDPVLPVKKSKSVLIVALLIGMAILVALVVFFVLNRSNLKEDEDGIKTPEEVSFVMPEVKYRNISYLDISNKETASLVIYDPVTKEKQTNFPKLKFGDETRISIGKWSPNGQYLPVVASSFVDDSYQKGESFFFFYNSATKELIQAIHSPTNNTLDNRWMDSGYLDMTGDWINDTDFLIDMESTDSTTYNTLVISYVTVTGELKDYTVTANTNSPFKTGIQNILRSNVLSYKSRGNSIDGLKFYDVTYKNIPYTHTLDKYQPIGALNGDLIVLYKPFGKSLFVNPEAFEELKGLSEEEQVSKSLDLIMPKGQDSLIFSDKSGTKVKEVPLKYDDWTSVEATVVEEENYILVYQKERAILPTKGRYLKVSSSGSIEILYEGEAKSSLTESTTLLTPDKKAFVIRDSESSYSLFDFTSKTKTSLCDNCSSIRINNPWQVRWVY